MSRYIYETNKVNSSRKEKWCGCCNKTIKKGESSITVTYFDGSEFQATHVCSDKCLKKYTEDFDSDDD